MANKCPVCNHDDRLTIDRKLVQGKKQSELASEYDIPYHTLSRHFNKHLTKQLKVAYERKQGAEGMDVIEEITNLIQTTRSILQDAQANKRNTLSLSAIKELRSQFELISKIQYAIMQQQQANQIDPAELDEFRIWKANQHKTSLDLNLLTKDEQEFVRSIALKKLSSTSGVTSKAERASEWADTEIVDAEVVPQDDKAEIGLRTGENLDNPFLEEVPKLRRTR